MKMTLFKFVVNLLIQWKDKKYIQEPEHTWFSCSNSVFVFGAEVWVAFSISFCLFLERFPPIKPKYDSKSGNSSKPA